jgi:ankyrin repeat protein
MPNRDFELDEFERQDSLCYVSPQTRLLNALEARYLDKFKEILRSNQRKTAIDVNYVYDDPYDKSLLEIACSFPYCSRFVEVLINYGAEVSSVNIIHKKSPLHFAIEFSDFETVKLLADTTTNINVRDSFGNTPLHKAAELNKVQIVDLLLQHPAVKVNAVNRKKQTPLHLAVVKGNRDCALKLIEDTRVDLDELRDFSGKTCREMISDKLPGIELQPTKRIGDGETTLFSLLHDRDVQTFQKRCSENKSHVNDDDGKYTYLQYACLYGLPEAVETLLENGANANSTCYQHQAPPIMIAARQGYLQIVEMLVERGNVIYDGTNEGTVLHAVLDGMTKSHDILGVSFEASKHVKCLEYLLKSVSPDVLNINAQNINGHTALHLAVKLHDKNIIRLLLDHGAYIGSRCNQGNMPISLIDAEVFKEYLDDCVVTNEKRPIEETYEIVYKYHFLVPPKICSRDYSAKVTGFETAESGASHKRAVVSETEPLIELSRIPELRDLLKHPVLTSFLNLKWFTIRKYFWVNLSFYLAFWIFLTAYVLTVYSIEIDDPKSANRI